MPELIKLTLASDMAELVKTLNTNGQEALSLVYSSDSAPPDAQPALEVAAFKSGEGRIPRLENRIKSCQMAAKHLAICLGLTDRKSKKTLAEIFRAGELVAGPLIAFLPNDAGNGIRLMYAQFTFVFIAPAGRQYEYCSLESTS